MSDAIRLCVQAERCFRLARGPASARLADELEALGRVFERGARKVEASLLHRSSQPTIRESEQYVEAGEMVEAV
jgi:hypothetical protein